MTRLLVTLSCGHVSEAPPVVGLHDIVQCERCGAKAVVIGIGGEDD